MSFHDDIFIEMMRKYRECPDEREGIVNEIFEYIDNDVIANWEYEECQAPKGACIIEGYLNKLTPDELRYAIRPMLLYEILVAESHGLRGVTLPPTKTEYILTAILNHLFIEKRKADDFPEIIE